MKDYEIICYRLMWKKCEIDNWTSFDFSTEEEGVEMLKHYLSENCICKLLKIQALVGDF